MHHCCQVSTDATQCWVRGGGVPGTVCASLLSGANRRHTVLGVTCQWDNVCIIPVRCQQAPHSVGGGGGVPGTMCACAGEFLE